MSKASVQDQFGTISKWETPRFANGDGSATEDSKNVEQVRLQIFKESKRLGYQAGLEQAAAETKTKLAAVDSFLSALSQPFNDQNQQLAEQLGLLAGKIAKSLVRRELRTEPESIMALVRDTVAALNTNVHRVNIHLHPENAKLIRSLLNTDSDEEGWKIIDDPLVSHSDCKVSSRDSLIDADLETRINLIITQFLGDERSEKRK